MQEGGVGHSGRGGGKQRKARRGGGGGVRGGGYTELNIDFLPPLSWRTGVPVDFVCACIHNSRGGMCLFMYPWGVVVCVHYART